MEQLNTVSVNINAKHVYGHLCLMWLMLLFQYSIAPVLNSASLDLIQSRFFYSKQVLM